MLKDHAAITPRPKRTLFVLGRKPTETSRVLELHATSVDLYPRNTDAESVIMDHNAELHSQLGFRLGPQFRKRRTSK